MSGIELFSCDNIETHAAHVILLLLIFFLTLLPVDVEQCYRLVICFIFFSILYYSAFMAY